MSRLTQLLGGLILCLVICGPSGLAATGLTATKTTRMHRAAGPAKVAHKAGATAALAGHKAGAKATVSVRGRRGRGAKPRLAVAPVAPTEV